jgi:proteasome assembly chaperone (PAC2) family protein
MVSTVHVYVENTPKLHNPVMLCGLPDSGNVARFVIEESVKQLRAEKFAEL